MIDDYNKQDTEVVDESTAGTVAKTVAKGIGSALKSIGGGIVKTTVASVVLAVLLAFIITGTEKGKKRKIDKYLAANPQVKKAVDDAKNKVADLFKKGINDEAFTTDKPDQNRAGGFQILNPNTNSVMYSATIGEYWLTEIEPDDNIDDELEDPDWGYSFDLDTPEKKAFAKKLKDRYAAFEKAVKAITDEIHSQPNGDLIEIDLVPDFNDDAVFNTSDGNTFTAQDVVFVVMRIKFKDASSLEQTKEVEDAKEKLQKKFGKINESTDIDEVVNVLNEAFYIEPVNESAVEYEPINEMGVAGIVGIAAAAIIFTGTWINMGTNIVKAFKGAKKARKELDGINVKDMFDAAASAEKRFKDAIAAYPKIYKDCKAIDTFKKKTYTIKPFSDDPDKEMTDEEAAKADSFLYKYSMDRIVLYFDKSDDENPAIGYIFRAENTGNCITRNIKMKIFDKSLEKHKDYYIACFAYERGIRNQSTDSWAKKVMDIKDGKDSDKSSVSESFFEELTDDMITPVNEVFGLSKSEKEEKAAKRKALSDLEFSYDKKFNAFCLSVSGYSVDRLQSMLDKKSAELNDAKQEKSSASDRQKKLEAQVKIDYLENVCNKCKAMIKKKKSYEKK